MCLPDTTTGYGSTSDVQISQFFTEAHRCVEHTRIVALIVLNSVSGERATNSTCCDTKVCPRFCIGIAYCKLVVAVSHSTWA